MTQNYEFLSRALDKVASAIWVLNDDLSVVKFINTPFKTFISLPGEDINEADITPSFCVSRLAVVFGNEGQDPAKIEAAFHRLKDTPSFSTIMPTADGRHIKLERFPDTKGDVVITFTDVTDLQQAIQNARQAENAKTDFIANMSHEIRTPMNGVVGMAQILSGSELTDKQRKYVDVISRSGEALVTIINDVLDYSKLSSGKFAIEAEPFNFSEMVDDVVTLMGHTAREKNLELVFNMPYRPEWQLIGDAGRYRQILINLVGNAIKFTDEGYIKLSVAVEVVNGIAQTFVSIEDTGIGIEDDKLEKIFNQFEQADNSTTRKFGGTGLGLAISRELVEHMGGRLSVSSQHGKGSTFAFFAKLPLSNIEIAAPAAIAPMNNTPILIVDDVTVNLVVMKDQLKKIGARPICAKSGAQGLAIMRQLAERGMILPMVITDFQMPEMNGLDFIKTVRSDPSIAMTPVMVLSSVNMLPYKTELSSLGVRHIYEKPCLAHDLHKAVFDAVTEAQVKRLKTISTKHGPSHSLGDKRDAKKAETPQQEPPKKQAMRILIADDDPINRMVFAEMLSHPNLDLTLVEDGQQALDHFKSEQYDAILMDIAMPVKDGVSATRDIRAYETERNLSPTPIIAATAHAMKGDREKYLAAGMNDYLSKPIDKTKLSKAIKTWTRKRHVELRQAS